MLAWALAPFVEVLLWDRPPEPRWRAPSGCPTASQFEHVVSTADDRAEITEVEGTVERVGVRRYRLDLRLVQGGIESRRTIEADRCSTLLEATLFVVELAHRIASPGRSGPVDSLSDADASPTSVEAPDAPRVPEEALVPEEPPRSADAMSRPAVAPPTDTLPKPTLRNTTARRFAWIIRAEAGPALGPIARVHGRVGGHVGFGGRRALAVVGVGYDTPVRIEQANTDVGARFDAITAAVRGCWTPRWSWGSVATCGGAEAGAIRGRGFGLRTNRTAVEPWGAALASVGVTGRLGRGFGLGVELQALLGFVRPRFGIDDFEAPLTQAVPAVGRLVAVVGWN